MSNAITRLSGLANLGNTCYINSCFQILSHLDELNGIFTEKTNLNDLNDSVVVIEYNNLRDLLFQKNCTVAPNRFINFVQKVAGEKNRELFTGFAQNDVTEFITFLIECFHNSIKRKVNINVNGDKKNKKDELAICCYNKLKDLYSNDYSEIIHLFYGITVSQLKSVHDLSELSLTCESFCNLSLPIPVDKPVCSIYECFELFTQNELLSGDNAWFNEKTGKKQDIFKTMQFWSLPNILIIELKRFNNMNNKLRNFVTTPIYNLDLSRYVIGYNSTKYIYDLFGVANHSGVALGGHYTATVKNYDNNWYNFNDTTVNKIDEDKIITNQCYCLFYKIKIL